MDQLNYILGKDVFSYSSGKNRDMPTPFWSHMMYVKESWAILGVSPNLGPSMEGLVNTPVIWGLLGPHF